ncbi:unnamed protein product [Ascophyllum nodosum]
MNVSDSQARQDEASVIDIEHLHDRAQEEYNVVCKLTDRHGHALDIFHEGYQQLHEAVKASLCSNESARQRTDQLEAELNGHRDTLGNLDTYEEDAQNSKLSLLSVLEAMQELFGEVQKREAQKRETAEKLRVKIESGSKRVDIGSGWTSDQEATRKALLAEAEELQREVEIKRRDHITLRGEVTAITLHLEQKQEKARLARERVDSVEGRLVAIKEETRSEAARKSHMEGLLVGYQEKAMKDQETCKRQREYLNAEAKSIAILEGQLRASKEDMERCLSEYDELFRTIQRVSEELTAQVATNSALQEENATKRPTLGETMAILRTLEEESRKTAKLKELAQKKIDEAEARRHQFEENREKLKSEIHGLRSVELKAGQKSIAALKRQVEEAKREKDILDRKHLSSDQVTSMIYDLTKENESTLRSLSDYRESMKHSIRGLRSRIGHLMKERERAEKDSLEHNQRWQERTEEFKMQGAQIANLQKEKAATVTRLKQQQNLYEAVRSDRNVHSKNLIETQASFPFFSRVFSGHECLGAQDVIRNMKRRFKIMSHNIEKLKEDITIMDHSLVKEHFNYHNVEKEKESLCNEVTKVKNQIVSGEHIALNQRSELQKLARIVQEADEERQRQVKEQDAIINEKGVLFGQLMKRSDELATLYDKIRVQTSSMYQGEVQYHQLLSTIRDLEAQIRFMGNKVVKSVSQEGNLDEIPTACNKLEKELRREQVKMTALKDALEVPLNVHRWRKLESSDPERYDLVTKAQSLQRILVAKTESVAKKDMLIQKKEKLYVELKKILGRQPGPDVEKQLAVYQENLKNKLKQMKAMEAELDMYKQQVDLFKSDIETTNNAMRALRYKWVADQRKGESHRREVSNRLDDSNHGTLGGGNSPATSAAPATVMQPLEQFEGDTMNNDINDN